MVSTLSFEAVAWLPKRHERHSATAAIRYQVDAFSVRLRASEYLKQADGRIHKLYNEWIRDLEATIQAEVAAEY